MTVTRELILRNKLWTHFVYQMIKNLHNLVNILTLCSRFKKMNKYNKPVVHLSALSSTTNEKCFFEKKNWKWIKIKIEKFEIFIAHRITHSTLIIIIIIRNFNLCTLMFKFMSCKIWLFIIKEGIQTKN